MTIVKGYAARAASEPLQPFSFERREPQDDDVVISIRFCGVCHSDIGTVDNAWGFSTYPVVPGHEITGVVTAVGSRVTKFQVGDRVGVGCFVNSCTTCATRDPDVEQYMPGLTPTYTGFEADGRTRTFGGYSDSIVVREGYVLSIPHALQLDSAAPLLCAGIAMYSPLRHWKAGPGTRVAIVGMGGLGHVGVQLARAMGAEVTVLSGSPSKSEDGLRMGAHRFVATRSPGTFQELARAFDLILCTVSGAIDWDAYLSLLKIDGTLVMLGVPENPVTLSALSLLTARRSLSGSLMGSIRETQDMLDFCARHGIETQIETIPIQSINDAFERLRTGDVRYRFVIDMASLTQAPRSSR